ncbi:MAG TPA: hydrogenase maturation nickel metallochaperone HypA [Terracidiphilus sp.]
MHELSIATSIVDSVTETAAAYPGARVLEVRLRVGALASVVEDSLQFCWTIVTEDTPLAGSKLIVHTLPIVVHCVNCDADSELSGVQNFHCPRCGQIAADFRQGRELEIESIEIEEPERAQPVAASAEKVEESQP